MKLKKKQNKKEEIKKTKTIVISKFLCWILNLKDLEIINEYSEKITYLETISRKYDDYDNYANCDDYDNFSDEKVLSFKIILNLESFLLIN